MMTKVEGGFMTNFILKSVQRSAQWSGEWKTGSLYNNENNDIISCKYIRCLSHVMSPTIFISLHPNATLWHPSFVIADAATAAIFYMKKIIDFSFYRLIFFVLYFASSLIRAEVSSSSQECGILLVSERDDIWYRSYIFNRFFIASSLKIGSIEIIEMWREMSKKKSLASFSSFHFLSYWRGASIFSFSRPKRCSKEVAVWRAPSFVTQIDYRCFLVN